MRSFLLAVKLAVVLTLVLGGTLCSVFFLFLHVAGDELMEVIVRLNAYDGAETAEAVEALLAAQPTGGRGLDDPAIAARVEADRRRWGIHMTLEPWDARAPREPVKTFGRGGLPPTIDVAGRQTAVVGLPYFLVEVPVLLDGRPVARLVVGNVRHASAVHRAFHHGLVRIGLVALVGVIALTVYLTRPLRRMSRSMDQVAAGDLDHRVTVRGGDEMAAMGRSFNAMAERIQHMVVGQKELLAGVSHELRSPLTRMKMNLALLRDSASTARASAAAAERIDALETEIDALDDLVGELLLASRLDLAAEPVTVETIDLEPLVENVWQRTVGADGTTDPGPTLHRSGDLGRIEANRPLVERMFRNLFENVARHAPGSAVAVSAERRADRIEITVADNGPGVVDGRIERLFEPFYRGDRARSPGTDSVGLGLMIVERAARAHGGRVRAEAVVPHGLAVTFDFPASV